jgi:uncharacterized protein YecE (DUF72 family)
MSKIRIGISGWRYAPWRGRFYPKALIHKQELSYASRKVDTIEINGSFYALQRPESYVRWYHDAPKSFVFSVKGPRFITHVRRLRNIEQPLANFFASGVLNLKEKLGPLLWQFPPSFAFDAATFDAFLALLPKTTKQAIKLAQHRDSHLKYPRLTFPERNHRIRHAIEIRHESFIDDQFITMLRKHHIALVVADTAGKWPLLEDVTAGFMYLRLHGDKKIYASGYSDEALASWTHRIRTWARGSQPRDAERVSNKSPRPCASRDIYCYFDNDIKVKAPRDAMSLSARLGV